MWVARLYRRVLLFVRVYAQASACLTFGWILLVCGGSMQPTDSAQSPVKGKVVR